MPHLDEVLLRPEEEGEEGVGADGVQEGVLPGRGRVPGRRRKDREGHGHHEDGLLMHVVPVGGRVWWEGGQVWRVVWWVGEWEGWLVGGWVGGLVGGRKHIRDGLGRGEGVEQRSKVRAPCCAPGAGLASAAAQPAAYPSMKLHMVQ